MAGAALLRGVAVVLDTVTAVLPTTQKAQLQVNTVVTVHTKRRNLAVAFVMVTLQQLLPFLFCKPKDHVGGKLELKQILAIIPVRATLFSN